MKKHNAPANQSTVGSTEDKWLAKMQKLLNQCPPTLGFYTVGDPCLHIYDLRAEPFILDMQDAGKDFCVAVYDSKAGLGELIFPARVHATAG